MKKILVLLIVFASNFLAQEVDSSINDCFSTLRKYTRHIHVNSPPLNKTNMSAREKQSLRVPDARSETNQKVDRMDKNEIMDLARKINDAVLENPIYFKKIMIQDEYEVKEQIKNGKSDLISIDIFNVMLKHKLQKLGEPKISEFLTIPLILRVKIKQINKVTHNTTDQISFTLPKTEIKCAVNSVVKGNSLFKKDDLLEFYYMDFWKKTDHKFIEGEEYCLPLALRIREDGSYNLALVTNVKTDGVFPIRENKIIDGTNYFGLGVKLEWSDFKAEFINKYIRF